MKAGILLSILILGFQAQALVTKGTDRVAKCTSYQVIEAGTAETDDLISRIIKEGGEVASEKSTYGLSFKNLRIDFEKRQVKVDVMQRVVMGFNKVLIRDLVISADNQDLERQVNKLNYDMTLMREVCVGPNKELVRAE
jgi:hypothetical protein